jgi:hypothetical protein
MPNVTTALPLQSSGFFLPSNLGDVRDEQGERVHKDISIMEKCDQAMLTNYS